MKRMICLFVAVVVVFSVSSVCSGEDNTKCETCVCYANKVDRVKRIFKLRGKIMVVVSDRDEKNLEKDNNVSIETIMEYRDRLSDACIKDKNVELRRKALSDISSIETMIRVKRYPLWELPVSCRQALGLSCPPAVVTSQKQE